MSNITCPSCGSSIVHVQATAIQKPQPRHGIVYWLLVGWWLHPILWLWATIPMLIWRLINPNRKTKTEVHSIAVCQSCGKSWRVG